MRFKTQEFKTLWNALYHHRATYYRQHYKDDEEPVKRINNLMEKVNEPTPLDFED